MVVRCVTHACHAARAASSRTSALPLKPDGMTHIATRTSAALLLVAALGACARNAEPDTDPDIVERPVQIAPAVNGPVAYGDCAEAMRRASQKTDVFVDRVPTPKTNLAAALRSKSAPAAVRRA